MPNHILSSRKDGDDELEVKKIKGKVVLMKKSVLDFEFISNHVSLQLISSVNTAPTSEYNRSLKGKIGREAFLQKWNRTLPSLTPHDSTFDVDFDYEEDVGVPGAFIIRNSHHSEFYLKTLTLEHVPGHGCVRFVCNSWIYPAKHYKTDRVFFANQAYVPSKTPAPLLYYRHQELKTLRGDGTGELQEWDRVYDYAYYNDLGDPDRGEEYARPILGGSSMFPYPRRGRTGRPPTKNDPNSESKISVLKSFNVYVPRDERFGHVKMSDFLGFNLKSVSQVFLPELTKMPDSLRNEFDSFDDILQIYEGGLKLPEIHENDKSSPFHLLKQAFPADGEGLFKFPVPQLIEGDKSAWRTDEEFAREMLAGVNPVMICGLKKFPPTSTLDPRLYGDQTSRITQDHIQDQLEGLTVDEALKTNRLFILNHHDALMPYVRRINTTSSKIYATRTLLFLLNDGCLKPVAIELSLAHPDGDQFGAVSKVYTPATVGVEGSLWMLAKAYVCVNDSGLHELISHWLHTHCVIEPIVIATNRQLSVLHPIYKLLHPHFRDTMFINGLGRQILINAGGAAELTVFQGKYAMEQSSMVYKDWTFQSQALPNDLVKRGMAVEDSNAPHGVRLLVEDYPFAVDGLEIWSATKMWVADYVKFYYASDGEVCNDTELQLWWTEVREKGHGDKKDEPWWPKMHTRKDLIDSCTTIIWVASALHASTNFGQYAYGGFMPNRPTISRRLMPEAGTPEYDELCTNPDKVFLRTVTPRLQMLVGIALVEVLSRHSSDEVYLGQRGTDWTRDEEVIRASGKFEKKLREVEKGINERNKDEKLKNRSGPVKVPYTLLYPSSEGNGVTGRGIPNSVAI